MVAGELLWRMRALGRAGTWGHAEGLDTGDSSNFLGDLNPFSDPSKAPSSGRDSCFPATQTPLSSSHL